MIAFQSCIGMNDITVHQFTIGNINFEQHHLLSFPILSCKALLDPVLLEGVSVVCHVSYPSIPAADIKCTKSPFLKASSILVVALWLLKAS